MICNVPLPSMMQLTKEERIFVVRSFDTINNATGVIRAYQEHFQGRCVSRVTVRRTIAKILLAWNNTKQK